VSARSSGGSQEMGRGLAKGIERGGGNHFI
jgi:hypothetical protein